MNIQTLIAKVKEMRQAQKDFFRLTYEAKKDPFKYEERKRVLAESKALEKEVDEMILKIEEPDESISFTSGKGMEATIMVAEQLGLDPPGLAIAKLHKEGKMHPGMYGILESYSIEAIKLVHNANMVEKAKNLTRQYLTETNP